MAQTRTFPQWMYAYRSAFYIFGRALLGLFLFLKGIYFVFNNQLLANLLEQSSFHIHNLTLVYFVSIVHICGGAFIALGLLTRAAIIAQLPVLLGAVFFNIQARTLGIQSEWFLALVIFFMLLYFLVNGPGEVSMDAYRKNKQI